MTKTQDYYKILGLRKEASLDEVKSAYKKLAKKYHPDLNKEQGSEEKFKEVLEAYQILSDPQKKSNYDQFGHASEGFSGFQGFEGQQDFDFSDIFGGFGGFSEFGSMADTLRQAFSSRNRTRNTSLRGTDLAVDLSLSFEEAAFGVEKNISVTRIEECSACKGKGGKGEETCVKCNGSGVLTENRRTPFGIFRTQTTCPKCGGNGKTIKNICKKCSGAGRLKAKKNIKIKIPAGIDSGNHLRMEGEGNAGSNGGQSGDLFIVIFVEPHKLFKRDGADIFTEVPISFAESALGTKLEVPILKGEATVKIPAGTQTDTIFRLSEKGIKKISEKGYGDEYVKVIIQTPKKLNKKQKKLFKELEKEEKLAKKRKNFFSKFRHSD